MVRALWRHASPKVGIAPIRPAEMLPGTARYRSGRETGRRRFERVALQQGLIEANFRARLHEATRTGSPLGGDQFIEQCEQQAGLSLRKQKPGPKPKPLVSCVGPSAV